VPAGCAASGVPAAPGPPATAPCLRRLRGSPLRILSAQGAREGHRHRHKRGGGGTGVGVCSLSGGVLLVHVLRRGMHCGASLTQQMHQRHTQGPQRHTRCTSGTPWVVVCTFVGL